MLPLAAGRLIMVRAVTAAVLLACMPRIEAQALAPAPPPPLANSNASATALPSMGEGSEITAGEERRIGDRIAASIYRDPDYVDDPVLVDYVQGIWQPLLAAARARGELPAELQERFAFEFMLLRDRSVNAFALPGGYLGVHLGLLAVVSNRDELAGVLAHELSHVTQRHISRLITEQARQAPWMLAAMILGALAASKSPQAASAAVVAGQAVAAQTQLDFSRDMEREADRVGWGVMSDAGFSPRGVVSMFEKLQQAARLNDNGSFPYLRSHPLNTQRIAEAQARNQLAKAAGAAAVGVAAQEGSAARFLDAMMSARAQVLVEPGVDVLWTMVAEGQRMAAGAVPSAATRAAGSASAAAVAASGAPGTLANGRAPRTANDAKAAGALYAGAFAAAKLRDFARARTLAASVRDLTAGKPPAARAAQLLLLEIDLLQGVPPTDSSKLSLASNDTRAETLLVGRTLLGMGRAAEVSGRLQTWVAAQPRDAAAWQLLSAAFAAQGQVVRAIRAEAEARVAQLDYSGALDRFRAAQDLLRAEPRSADYMEASIIDTRTRQMQAIVKEEALQDKKER